MQELRFSEHKEESLILVNPAGEQFELILDESNLDAIRDAIRSRRTPSQSIKPREIQTRLRAGASSEEVAEALEIDVSDVQRYEGPINAERVFMLNNSKAVEVRTTNNSGETVQQFGPVIEERVNRIAQMSPRWSAWRDAEDGWMISANFSVDAEDRKAVWAFDHRKKILIPVSAEAVSLSKQDSIGETLIPTLRAVENFKDDSDHQDFDQDDQHETDDVQIEETKASKEDQVAHHAHPSTANITSEDNHLLNDFARRQKIEQRAMAVDNSEFQPQSETADLLEALRQRRSQRDNESHIKTLDEDLREPISFDKNRLKTSEVAEDHQETLEADELTNTKSKKGRPAVPSWEEILFGGKSENSDEES